MSRAQEEEGIGGGVWGILARAKSRYCNRIAVADGDSRFSYGELHARASALAVFLREQRIEAGDRIAICGFNSHVYIEAYFAAAGIGALLVPLNHRLSASELAFILNDSGARWLVADSALQGLVRDVLTCETSLEGVMWIGQAKRVSLPSHALEEAVASRAHEFQRGRPEADLGLRSYDTGVAGDHIAQLYYTSGTTGRPKGVMLTHKNVCAHAEAATLELELTERDVWGHFAPLFHLADAWATFAITQVGGRHVMLPRFDAGDTLSLIEREQVTLTNLVPSMLLRLVEHPRAETTDCSSLRLLLSGGAPIAPDLVRRAIATLGCEYAQTYGMTETSPYLTLSLLNDRMRELPAEEQLAYKAKTGRPFRGVDLRVVDESGRDVEADEEHVGEIRVRGETITPGYWKRPDETALAFADGWLCTGDLAVVDGEGYVTIVDRKKDVILSGGETIYSIEIENVLYRHPKVSEAAVIGIPDGEWGEAVCAAIVLEEGESANGEELRSFCRAHLASFKLPKAVAFVESLPKTGSGKTDKRELRERFRDCPPSPETV